jgi:hypothetical protein
MKTTEINSPQTLVPAPQAEVYQFLGNFNNFANLMPEQVTNWKSTDDTCSFTIQGMGEFGLKMVERIPSSRISIEPSMDKPLPITFMLICLLAEMPESKTEALIKIETEMPPMIAMMAGRPLQNLVNVLAQRLQEHFSKT